MVNKGVQHFSDEDLNNLNGVSPDQIIRFLEDFRKFHYNQKPAPAKLISLRVPQGLLDTFKQKALIEGVGYQVKIKELMKQWVDS